MKRLLCVLGIGVLIVSAMGARAHETPVGPTCTALQSFSNDGSIVELDERIAAGKAHLRDAVKAAKASGDRQLATLTRAFQAAFGPAVARPNNRSAQRALNKAGIALWGYCARNGSPIRRTTDPSLPTATS